MLMVYSEHIVASFMVPESNAGIKRPSPSGMEDGVTHPTPANCAGIAEHAATHRACLIAPENWKEDLASKLGHFEALRHGVFALPYYTAEVIGIGVPFRVEQQYLRIWAQAQSIAQLR